MVENCHNSHKLPVELNIEGRVESVTWSFGSASTSVDETSRTWSMTEMMSSHRSTPSKNSTYHEWIQRTISPREYFPYRSMGMIVFGLLLAIV